MKMQEIINQMTATNPTLLTGTDKGGKLVTVFGR